MRRDHRERPGAREALQHSWLQGQAGEQDAGKPISQAIVQRLQVRPHVLQRCPKLAALLEVMRCCAEQGRIAITF